MPEPQGCPISTHSKIMLTNDLLCHLDIRASCPDFFGVLSSLKLLSCFETAFANLHCNNKTSAVIGEWQTMYRCSDALLQFPYC